MIFIIILILTRTNPMISLFNLIIFYILLALLFYCFNISILSLLYLLIYVGAISILFIFILSLININYSELYYKSYKSDILLILYSILLILFIYNYKNDIINKDIVLINNIDMNYISNTLELKVIGELLYTEYSIIFLIIGSILLLSIISTILLIARINKN
jgi:NADH:ubiquinone oxidoreductase subunit 6 (subunit J)